MKKIILIMMAFLMVLSIVFAAEPNGNSSMPDIKITSMENNIHDSNNTENNAVKTDLETKQENKGAESEIKNQVQEKVKLQAGEFTGEDGKQIKVESKEGNKMQLKVGDSSAETSLEMTQEQNQDKTMLKAKLSNGREAEIKVMPDTASEKAIERLRLKSCTEEEGCSIELKEVGSGDKVKAVYQVKAQKEAKILGLFKTKMNVEAEIDAETGDVLNSKKPWWSFLATEA